MYLALNLPSPARFGPVGHFGVLMFFVHTSLVLMMSMERSKLPGPLLFRNFYIRRIFGIYPLSIAVVLLMFVFHIPPIGWDEALFKPVSYPELLSNLALMMNLTRSDLVWNPLWSLPWEVQVYAVLPALYLFFRRHNSLRALFVGWGLTALIAWLAPHVSGRPGFIVQFAPCFFAGILAFHLKKMKRSRLPGWAFPVSLVMVLLGYRVFPTFGGWVPCLILALLIPACREIQSAAVIAACHRIPRYSYGIYLSHTPLLWFAFKVVKAHVAVQVLLFSGLMVLVPMAMYHALEAPMIRLGNRLSLVPHVEPTSTALTTQP